MARDEKKPEVVTQYDRESIGSQSTEDTKIGERHSQFLTNPVDLATNVRDSTASASDSSEQPSVMMKNASDNVVVTEITKSEAAGAEPKIERPVNPMLALEKEAEENFKPTTLKFWLIISCNFLALFLVALDRAIVATAIPQISNDFKSLGDIGWYGSAYMLTCASCQLVFGRIYKLYDLRFTYMACVVVFEIGSILCAAAPSSVVFVIGRAVTGLGAAGLMTGVMLVLIPMVPLRKRPMFQSMFGLIFGVSSAVGPLLGGAFTSNVSWRWCFWINLPIGAFAMFFLCLFLKASKKPQQSGTFMEHFMRLDPLGTLSIVPSIVCLLLALQWGGIRYAWSDWRIILLLVLFGVLFIVFAIVQVLNPETATVPVRIIKQRSILAGNIFMFSIGGSMMLCLFYLPLWFQTTHDVSAVKSGVYLLPLVIGLIIASILGGIVTTKVGYYVPTMLLSASLMATGEGLMTTFQPSTGHPIWIGYQFITGFGLGLGVQLVGLATQAVLPKPDIPAGVAISMFSQQLGGAIFTTAGQTILNACLVSQLASVPDLTPQVIIKSGATQLLKTVPEKYVSTVVDAYNSGCTKIFTAAMSLALVMVVAAASMEWINIKKKNEMKGGPPSAAAVMKTPGTSEKV